jgi:hypothetical protein
MEILIIAGEVFALVVGCGMVVIWSLGAQD